MSTIKNIAMGVCAAAMFVLPMACNSDSGFYSDEEVTYSSTKINAFNLKANRELLKGLDSVFFSIDLTTAKIFNADSLPYGTEVSHLLVNIATDGCSTVELRWPKKEGGDSIVDYLRHSTDSIDFSNGPVTLHVVSYDKVAERDYEVKVNVHRIKPDSLCWSEAARRSLPGAIANPTWQRTVRLADEAVCMTADESSVSVAYTANPSGEWTTLTPAMDFKADVNSLASTDEALYILSDEGELYTSADKGATWSTTGQTWVSIIGGYGSTLLGVANRSNTYMHVTWPATTEWAIDEDFPVSLASYPVILESKWAAGKQLLIVGGYREDGQTTRATWGYDGKRWARISTTYPRRAAGISVVPYMLAITDSASWRVREVPALIAFGGINGAEYDNTVYVSRDLGLNWKAGDELIQLPNAITPRYDAQALVFDRTLTDSRSADEWEYNPTRELPRWWIIADAPQSRATEPITSWECPYIYLFGGYDRDGVLYQSVWRGVINRLEFKPLQ